LTCAIPAGFAISARDLGIPSRIMALQYKVFDAIRHPRALEIAAEPGIEADFSAFRTARQCLVVTFKRSGEPVPTPVNFGLSGDACRLYFRSEPQVAKIRRLERDPRVRLCPCDWRGKPLGPLVQGRARVLPPSQDDWARSIIASNWRPEVRLLELGYDLIGVPQVYIEVTALAARELTV
jgi:uncharacterized protein